MDRDIEIDYMNQKRGISFELTKEEDLLYGYGAIITIELLEEICKKYAATQQTEPMEDDYDLEDLQLIK